MHVSRICATHLLLYLKATNTPFAQQACMGGCLDALLTRCGEIKATSIPLVPAISSHICSSVS